MTIGTVAEGHRNPGLVYAHCTACGRNGVAFFPGRWPRCFLCDVQHIWMGKTPEYPCVTPNGRVDSHMAYVRDGACAFCGEK